MKIVAVEYNKENNFLAPLQKHHSTLIYYIIE